MSEQRSYLKQLSEAKRLLGESLMRDEQLYLIQCRIHRKKRGLDAIATAKRLVNKRLGRWGSVKDVYGYEPSAGNPGSHLVNLVVSTMLSKHELKARVRWKVTLLNQSLSRKADGGMERTTGVHRGRTSQMD